MWERSEGRLWKIGSVGKNQCKVKQKWKETDTTDDRERNEDKKEWDNEVCGRNEKWGAWRDEEKEWIWMKRKWKNEESKQNEKEKVEEWKIWKKNNGRESVRMQREEENNKREKGRRDRENKIKGGQSVRMKSERNQNGRIRTVKEIEGDKSGRMKKMKENKMKKSGRMT